MSLYQEIFEQPQVFQRLLEARSSIKPVAEAALHAHPKFAFMAARGTSDNAARYANYLWGAYNHLPVALATPSLFTYYQQPPRLEDALVVGISQSGQSPDILAVVESGRKDGALTLAITNAIHSPLAQAADQVIDILAGPEKAVAATKTYTAQLLALALLSVEMAQDENRRQEMDRLPEWAAQLLAMDSQIANLASRYRYMERCVVMGRGFNYATAFEWSLKLKELSYVVAEPYSSADFQHGPIAMVEKGFPILVIAAGGPAFPSLLEVLQELRGEHRAELVVISDQDEALKLAQTPVPIPEGIPEWLSPLLNIIPAQLFCYYLTRAKGYDTEQPRSIHKVTETR